MSRRAILLITAFIALLVYFSYWEPLKRGIQVGDEAPQFTLNDQQREPASLAELRGQTVLLNFWATWCPPCVWEMPSLDRLYQKLSSENFSVVAVSVDEGGWRTIDAFLAKTPLSFQVLWDQQNTAVEAYGTYQLPESYLISPEGIVLKKYIGPKEWDRDDIVSEIKAQMPVEGSS